MGTKMTLEPGLHPASTSWTPRAVRCANCGELAREEVRERISDDEVVVRYGCSHCRKRVTRHYFESDSH
jgi:lysyl-tRNA synthetase class I